MKASPITTDQKSTNYKFEKRFYIAFFCVIFVLVLLNVFTPLRLNNDAGRYLGILEYMKGELGSGSDAAHDFLPHGYPAFLFLLDKINLLSPFTITLTNILCILASSFIITRIFKIENRVLYLTLLLISFINIKQFTLPVSDQFFTLIFSGTVYLWLKVFKGNRYLIVPALAGLVLAIYVRTAGVAIIAGIFLYLVYLNKGFIIRSKIILASVVFMGITPFVVFICAPAFFEKKIDYLRQLKAEELVDKPFSIFERLLIHFKELGEILFNIPYSKLSAIINFYGFNTAAWLLIIVGSLSLFIYIKVVKTLQLYKSFPFWVFISYLVIIFLWPFYDTRFLIPVLPVLAYLFFGHLTLWVKARVLKGMIIGVYVLLGAAGLVYSDALSLSNAFFLSHYGFDSYLTKTYRDHFNNQAQKIKPVFDVNSDFVPYILEKYDRKPLYFFYAPHNDK
jgi:hypothetical protein